MKKVAFLSLLFLWMLPVAGISQNNQLFTYTLAGSDFSVENILSAHEMQEKLEDLEIGDTAAVAFKARVKEVCQQKGCWMTLDISDTEEVMVKFKDYAFFVPKNIAQKEVILNGRAYITEMSVEEQRHYAEDAGKTSEEIEAIIKPAKKLSFLADGVKIKE